MCIRSARTAASAPNTSPRLITRVTCTAWAAAALALGVGVCGCGGSGPATTTAASTEASPTPAGRPPIVIGDKNIFPEQFVLGDLYEEALAAQGYRVSLNRNIGPPEVALQALETGTLSMYPEYVGVWDAGIAGYRRSFSSARDAYRAGQRFAAAHRLRLLNQTPFSDTGGIGVTLTYGVNHELTTIGDLRKVAATVVIGGPPEFQTDPGGLAGIEQSYGFAPAAFKSITVGDQYHELDKGTIQAADVNTTDAQLGTGGYLLLEDPSHVFGWGNVVPVVPEQVIAAEGPTFAATIDAVSAVLTTPVMRQLNAEVLLSHEDPKVVAMKFLEAHKLVPEPQSG